MTEATVLTPRARLAAFLCIFGLAGLFMSFVVPTIGATNTDPHLVTICHATRSASNPYNLITVDVASILQQGHDGHEGAPFDIETPPERWGDIIPPFDYGPGAQYGGKNWTDAGQLILLNGCEAPMPTTTTTSTTTTTPPQTQ
jgi:hypothetical protein